MNKERHPLNSRIRCIEGMLVMVVVGAISLSTHGEEGAAMKRCLTNEQLEEFEPNGEAEKWAQQQVTAGRVADLATRFPSETDRILRAEFVVQLVTHAISAAKAGRNGVQIKNAVIVGTLDLSNAVIAYDTSCTDCCFVDEVYCRKTRFERSLSLSGSIFRSEVDFTAAEIAGAFLADETQFTDPDQEANFDRVKTAAISTYKTLSLQEKLSSAKRMCRVISTPAERSSRAQIRRLCSTACESRNMHFFTRLSSTAQRLLHMRTSG
jgi:hypothetical protein